MSMPIFIEEQEVKVFFVSVCICVRMSNIPFISLLEIVTGNL